MKKSNLFMALVAFMCLAAPQGVQAQSFLKKLGGALGAQAGAATAADIVGNLLGTLELKTDSLQGTWVYSQPCIAFESENVLTKLGSSAVSSKAETSLKGLLQKAGFTEGKVSLTFNADSTGLISCAGRDTQMQWSLSGTDLTITFPVTKKSVHMNAKVKAGTLQVAMNADRLLTLVTSVTEKTAGLSTTMGALGAMTKNVKGMYLGLKYTRKE